MPCQSHSSNRIHAIKVKPKIKIGIFFPSLCGFLIELPGCYEALDIGRIETFASRNSDEWEFTLAAIFVDRLGCDGQELGDLLTREKRSHASPRIFLIISLVAVRSELIRPVFIWLAHVRECPASLDKRPNEYLFKIPQARNLAINSISFLFDLLDNLLNMLIFFVLHVNRLNMRLSIIYK